MCCNVFQLKQNQRQIYEQLKWKGPNFVRNNKASQINTRIQALRQILDNINCNW